MDIYQNEFRKQSIDQLMHLRPQDIKLLSDDTIRENITIIARPDEETKHQIEIIQKKLKSIDLNQYYYDSEQLHITLLGNININIQDDLIINAVNTVLPKYALQFKLVGLGSNMFASSVSAYPEFDIHALRAELRTIIGDPGDDYTIHLEMYEHMGWINYMRYLHIPSQVLLDTLLQYKDTQFGMMNSMVVEVYRNSSQVLDLKKAKKIYSYQY